MTSRSVRPRVEILEDRRVPASLFPATLPLSSLNGSNGFTLNGNADGDAAGQSVASAGDVNGDGFDDAIIGADGAKAGGTGRGQAYVVFGNPAGLPAALPLSGLTGGIGFTINGVADGDSSGYSVAGGADVNGDGFDDLLIGAGGANAGGTDRGQVYVIFGRSSFAATLDLSSLNGSNGFTLNGVADNDHAGRSVAGVADVNGDGLDDLLIGALDANAGGTDRGQAYVLFGQSSFAATLDLSSLNGSNGFILNGAADNDAAGVAVAGAGDVNADNIDDLIIGAFRANAGGTDRGQAYVVFGASSFAATLDLSSLNGSNGFILNGAADNDFAGFRVAGGGDVNGDGLDDLLVGAVGAKAGGTSRGQAYVVFGRSSFAATLALSALTGGNGFTLNGVADNDFAGRVASGDVNGDGLDDVIIGAYLAKAGGTGRGQAYVVFGQSSFAATLNLSSLNGSNGFTLNGIADNNLAGAAVASGGDFNGDGLDDLLIGARGANAGGSARGQAYMIFGRTRVALAVGPDAGSLPLVKICGPTGGLVAQLLPYSDTFTGGVRVAVGNVIGDDELDVVMVPGPGRAVQVQVFDGGTRQLVLYSGLPGFLAYGPNYLSGASVAVGDTDGDGIGEIVVAPNKGPNRAVKILNGNGTFVTSFFPYGAAFKGGVCVAVGNTDGIATAEIVTVKATGVPTLRVFSGAGSLLHSFNVVGNYVAVGDVDNDAVNEIIVGSSSGQPGRVRTYNAATGALETTLTPYATAFKGGVRVGVVQRQGQFNLLTGPGKGTVAQVKIFDGLNIPLLDSFFAYGDEFTGGLFVAGG